MKNIKARTPPRVLGYLETELEKDELDYIQKCIGKRRKRMNERLAGNIKASYELEDTDNWFFNKVLIPQCQIYAEHFCNMGDRIPISRPHPFRLQNWWVNYQRQGEFNPSHNHYGIYSFVIWLKIPTEYKDQKLKPEAKNSNSMAVSNFQIHYSNILGEHDSCFYELDKSYEGRMLFFPSQLKHQVYPFYKCNKERISVAGNLELDTSSIPEQLRNVTEISKPMQL